MLIKFLKVLFWLFIVYLVIDLLWVMSPVFCCAVIGSAIVAAIWNGLSNDGWFGEW